MIRFAAAVAFASALTLVSACTARQAPPAMMRSPSPSSPPLPPPPSPWALYTHFALVPSPEMTVMANEPWYEIVGVALEQGKVRRIRAPRFCSEGQLWSSEGDGAVFFEEGTLRNDGAGPIAAIRVIDCDRCIPPSTGWPIERLPVAYPSPDTVRIGDIVYDRRLDPESHVCPPDARNVDRRAGQIETP